MYSKPVIFVVISILVVALIYSSSAAPNVYAVPPDPKFNTGECVNSPETLTVICCWNTPGEGYFEATCQVCHIDTETGNYDNCDPPEVQGPPQIGQKAPQVTPPLPLSTPPPAGKDIAAPLGEGDPTPTTPTLPTPPPTTGENVFPEEITPGVAPRTAGEETPPDPLPPCAEGLEFDDELGLCVPVESPVAEQPEEAAQEPQAEDEQQLPEGGNSEENSGS